MVGGSQGENWYKHLVSLPLQFIHKVQTGVHKKWIQFSSFLSETRLTIAALFRGAKFKLEGRLVTSIDDAQVVGHDCDSLRVDIGHTDGTSFKPSMSV